MARKARRRAEQAKESGHGATLIGKVVHARRNFRSVFTVNDYCVVLTETPKTALLAPIKDKVSRYKYTEREGIGFDLPVITDGRAIVEALLGIAWAVRQKNPCGKMFVARFHGKPAGFSETRTHDAALYAQTGDNETAIEVFRARKCTDEGGVIWLKHREHGSFRVWDGLEKEFDLDIGG